MIKTIRAIINLIKHKNKIKDYDKRLDLQPRKKQLKDT